MGVEWSRLSLVSPPPVELIGDSAAIDHVRETIDRLALSAASVLVTGPSGSGKEVVAQRLHQRSRRAAGPFVAINCAAIPRELLESELFGHEAGSFTGATRLRRGRFEAASGGTLFLDEIGDMPTDMQVKLLRILETRVVERVGGGAPLPVDVRLVAATNVDLGAAIVAGTFREDLFYRLNVVRIALPPLADRTADIAPLLEFFAAGAGDTAPRFDESAVAWLTEQPWPGNVRELRNFVERATAFHPGSNVDATGAARLLQAERQPVDRWLAQPVARQRPIAPLSAPIDLKALLDEVEQAYIEQALNMGDGTIAGSARLLGLRRTTLIEKMRRLKIRRAMLD